jgi:hypothetical protein
MEHNYVIKEGIIENYLLHRLSERETDDFEEHLLYCKECRKMLLETKEIIALNQYMAIRTSSERKEEVVTQKRVSFYSPWMKAAAVLLLTVCSAGIIWHLLQKPTESFVRNEIKPNQVKNVPDSIRVEETMPLENPNQPVIQHKNELLSDNYKELLLYETAIKNNLRGENIEVLSPAKSSKIAFGKKVIFSLKDNNSKILLSVINNTGKSIFEETITTPFTLPLKLSRGLYYWEIIENDEVVFVSKFYIR